MKHQGSYLILRTLTMAVVLCIPFLANGEDQNLEPISIELPEPFFGGTPWDGPVPKNFEFNSYALRPPFLAPKGSVNVAFKKPVCSSVPPIHGELEQITDGEKDYHKSISQVGFPGGMQWVQVDLKRKHNIYAIMMWHFCRESRIYWDIVVRISNDPKFDKEVITVYNNDDDNSTGFGVGPDKTYFESYQGRLIDAGGVSGRYVRFYSNENTHDDFNHYVELEVYGLPQSEPAILRDKHKRKSVDKK